MKQKEAMHAYEEASKALVKYCDKETDFEAVIIESEYPFTVKFTPNSQISMFDMMVDEETGEVGASGELTIAVGLTTTVKSTLAIKMNSATLKKLIKLSEKVGALYYRAFRENAGNIEHSEEKTHNEMDER